jgi:hypothetical protein
MKILRISKYKDGGSVEVHTDEGVFTQDNSITTKRSGKEIGVWYVGGIKMLKNKKRLVAELVTLLTAHLREYEDFHSIGRTIRPYM